MDDSEKVKTEHSSKFPSPYLTPNTDVEFEAELGSKKCCMIPASQGILEYGIGIRSERKYLAIETDGEWQVLYQSGSTKQWRQLLGLVQFSQTMFPWIVKDSEWQAALPWPVHKRILAFQNRGKISFTLDPAQIPEITYANTSLIHSSVTATDLSDPQAKPQVETTEVYKKFAGAKAELTPVNFKEDGKPKEMPTFSTPPAGIIFNNGTIDAVWETPSFRYRVNFDPAPTDPKRRTTYTNTPYFEEHLVDQLAEKRQQYEAQYQNLPIQYQSAVSMEDYLNAMLGSEKERITRQEKRFSYPLNFYILVEPKNPNQFCPDSLKISAQQVDSLYWELAKHLEETEIWKTIREIQGSPSSRLTLEKAKELFGEEVLG